MVAKANTQIGSTWRYTTWKEVVSENIIRYVVTLKTLAVHPGCSERHLYMHFPTCVGEMITDLEAKMFSKR